MLKIDAHQHFWKYDPARDQWIDNSMRVLKSDFLPDDLAPVLSVNKIDGCIAVQANASEKENEFLIGLSDKNSFIRGIVGWVNLMADDLSKRLTHYKKIRVIKGFRHMVQDEKDRAFMLQPLFIKGVQQLKKFDFTYDMLIRKDQMEFSAPFAAALPGQKLVLDHMGKPGIKNAEIKEWEKSMVKLSAFKNVYCKVSGMVTEADHDNWKKKDFIPFLDIIDALFGPDRLMFGSDWPVCLLAATYRQTLEIAEDYFSKYSKEEQEKIFSGNAIKFYDLE